MKSKREPMQSNNGHSTIDRTPVKPITCATFERRINEVLDLRKEPVEDASLQLHANQCEPCSEILEDYQSVDDSMELLKSDVDRILSLQAKPAKEDSSRWPATLAVAVLAVLLLAGASWMLPGGRPGNGIADSVDGSPTSTASKSDLQLNSSIAINEFPSPKNGVAQKSESVPIHLMPGMAVSASQMSNWKELDFPGALSQVSLANVQFKRPEWQFITKQLVPLEAIYEYSKEIPAVRTLRGTVNMTIDILKKSIKSDTKPPADPDLGHRSVRSMLAFT